MEANCYRYFKYKGLRVEYEPKWFRFPKNEYGVWAYVPDMQIWLKKGSSCYFVEVKGYLDRQAKIKHLLFTRHYPGHRIYWILPKEYNLIRKLYSKSIPNWEY